MMRNQIIQEDLDYITSQDLPWKDFSHSRILITGANGFLPSYLVQTFLHLNELYPDLNLEVFGVVRNENKARKKFSSLLQRDDFKLIVQDVSDPIIFDEKVDYIIHAASQASPKYYGKDPVGTLKANVQGTYNLLEYARVHAVRSFLFFSSGDVYGAVDEANLPIEENSYGTLDPTDVRSCYGESKRMGENMCVSWYHQYKIPTKIVRVFHTYGPGMDLEDGRVHADFVANIVKGNDILIQSDGSAVRGFCYIADTTLGVLTVLLRGKTGEAYNVGEEKMTSISELAQTLVKVFPEKDLKVIKKTRQNDQDYLTSKISRAYPSTKKISALGWRTRFSLEEGFKRTVRSYQL